jgi:hypothetical protein
MKMRVLPKYIMRNVHVPGQWKYISHKKAWFESEGLSPWQAHTHTNLHQNIQQSTNTYLVSGNIFHKKACFESEGLSPWEALVDSRRDEDVG